MVEFTVGQGLLWKIKEAAFVEKSKDSKWDGKQRSAHQVHFYCCLHLQFAFEKTQEIDLSNSIINGVQEIAVYFYVC